MSDSAGLQRIGMIVLRSMRWPLLFLILVYVVGIAGFALIPGRDGEPMSFFHALYILSYTATTTGFGELPVPFSALQRAWAILLLHVTVIAWLYSIGSILKLIQNEQLRRALARYVFARRVAGMDEPFVIVCGFGDAGSLLGRSLNESAMSMVIIDSDPDRMKALSLRTFSVRAIGVCADAADPDTLLEAGLRHRHCHAIVAVTDDEHVNATVAVMTRALNPDLQPICRIDSRELVEQTEALGSVRVLDSFEVFADRLSAALHRPAVYALGNWFAQVADANLDYRIDCPAGRWIVCGYGRMGHRLEEGMNEEGVDTVVIDPDLDDDEVSERHIRSVADHDTLMRAGLADAACVIIATDDDTVNLRVMMIVRALNPDVFLVVRQNRHANDTVYTGAPVDLVVHPDRVIARRIQMELLSPGLQPLLDHLEHGPAAVLDELLVRLREAVGDGVPTLWVVGMDGIAMPPVGGGPTRGRTVEPLLGDLVRDPRDRDSLSGAVPLQMERDGVLQPVPPLDTPLRPGDRLLLCGTWKVRAAMQAMLRDPYALHYLITGEAPPRSYLFRWLDAKKPSTAG